MALSAVLLAAGLLPAPLQARTPVAAAAAPAACPPVLQHRFKRLQDEAPQDLCQYAGKVLLVVNTASFCGFTGQYEGLERLFARLGPRGLVVLGFPSNDFGQQEPGSDKQIADFCFNTYAVKFPMFSKVEVNGGNAHPLYQFLKEQAPGLLGSEGIKWNFTKFLVGKDGTVLERFAPTATPKDIEKKILPLLA